MQGSVSHVFENPSFHVWRCETLGGRQPVSSHRLSFVAFPIAVRSLTTIYPKTAEIELENSLILTLVAFGYQRRLSGASFPYFMTNRPSSSLGKTQIQNLECPWGIAGHEGTEDMVNDEQATKESSPYIDVNCLLTILSPLAVLVFNISIRCRKDVL